MALAHDYVNLRLESSWLEPQRSLLIFGSSLLLFLFEARAFMARASKITMLLRLEHQTRA
jgi:hypothetical protein